MSLKTELDAIGHREYTTATGRVIRARGDADLRDRVEPIIRHAGVQGPGLNYLAAYVRYRLGYRRSGTPTVPKELPGRALPFVEQRARDAASEALNARDRLEQERGRARDKARAARARGAR